MKFWNLERANNELSRQFVKFLTVLKLSPIYLLQRPAGYDLHLYGLMPLIGLGELIRRKKINFEFFPFVLLFLFSSLVSLWSFDFLAARRSFQVLCMVGFCSYLVNCFTDKQFVQLAKNALYLLAAYHLYDYIFGIKSQVLFLQTWVIYILRPGLLANANFTGILAAGLTIFFRLNKNNRLMFLSLVIVLLAQSKTAFFMLLTSAPIFFNVAERNNGNKIYAIFLFAVIVFSPGILLLIEYYTGSDTKLFINSWSGGRYAIQLSYLELVKSSTFGVGYDRSHELISPYLLNGSSIVVMGLYKTYFDDIGAHNTYLKVMAELGIAGYLLYISFIFLSLRTALRKNYELAIAFMSICAAQLWLEALNEFIFYFFIALILRPDVDSIFKKPTYN